ncbi:MAG TPA: VOC family protein [Bacillales bacterium]|nr:VOC family protein [Bacillales bacterium]
MALYSANGGSKLRTGGSNRPQYSTYGSHEKMDTQISFLSEGGSGTPVPDLSIEVDDLDEVLSRMKEAGISIEYGPAEEPWGVRRFFVRDPFGKLVNLLIHL